MMTTPHTTAQTAEPRTSPLISQTISIGSVSFPADENGGYLVYKADRNSSTAPLTPEAVRKIQEKHGAGTIGLGFDCATDFTGIWQLAKKYMPFEDSRAYIRISNQYHVTFDGRMNEEQAKTKLLESLLVTTTGDRTVMQEPNDFAGRQSVVESAHLVSCMLGKPIILRAGGNNRTSEAKELAIPPRVPSRQEVQELMDQFPNEFIMHGG